MNVHLPLSRVDVVEEREDDVFVLSHLLEKAGLLKVDYGGIQILDVDGLRRFHG